MFVYSSDAEYSLYPESLGEDEVSDTSLRPHKKSAHECQEPINPGDTIEYTGVNLVVGAPRSTRQCVVLAVQEAPSHNKLEDRENAFSLTLSNGEKLINSHVVRRIKIAKWRDGLVRDVVDHSNGKRRRISSFVLKQSNTLLEADRGRIFDNDRSGITQSYSRALENLKEGLKKKGVPTDIVWTPQPVRPKKNAEL